MSRVNIGDAAAAASSLKLTEFVSFPNTLNKKCIFAALYQGIGALYAEVCWLRWWKQSGI